MRLSASQILAWAEVAERLIALGVTSYGILRAAMTEAGVEADDAAIVALGARWDALRADVARASRPSV